MRYIYDLIITTFVGTLGGCIGSYLIFGYIHPLWIAAGGAGGAIVMIIDRYRNGDIYS
jgi:hypothetical protein